MRYPVVLLDVGETLIGPAVSFGATYAEVFGGLGVDAPADRLDACIREVWAEMLARKPSGADRFSRFAGGEDEFWLRFVGATLERATGGPQPRRRLLAGLRALRERFAGKEVWRVYPEVLPLLERLRGDGVRLGVVSNWDSRLPRLLEALGLREYFETLGVSHLEGIEKPDPVLFRRVLDRLGAEAHQALHVGDAPEFDLRGAQAAGIDALLVDRRGDLPAHYRAVPDLERLPQFARDGLPSGGRA